MAETTRFFSSCCDLVCFRSGSRNLSWKRYFPLMWLGKFSLPVAFARIKSVLLWETLFTKSHIRYVFSLSSGSLFKFLSKDMKCRQMYSSLLEKLMKYEPNIMLELVALCSGDLITLHRMYRGLSLFIFVSE